MEIFHNPRCRKSRETLALLEDNKVNPEIVLYLEEKLTQKRLKEVISKLGIKASQLVRKTEPIYKEKYKGKDISDAEWVKILVKEPKLIERPIVIKGKKAVIGRPPSNVLTLI